MSKTSTRDVKAFISIFGSLSAYKILNALVTDKQGYIRGIAEDTGMYPEEARKQLLKFFAAGLLTRSRLGKRVYYRFNPESQIAEALAKLLLSSDEEAQQPVKKSDAPKK
jgi:DNA-binding transcriptional ArsR family regulator